MGGRVSRLDRFYTNYEKSFERLEQEVQRLKSKRAKTSLRKSTVTFWSSVSIAVAVVIAAMLIYKIQQLPPGTLSYQEHFQQVGLSLGLPLVAGVLHWIVHRLAGFLDSRDGRKIKALEAAKRKMVKELKDMSNFEKTKALIDKYDPDAKPVLAMAPSPGQGGKHHGGWSGSPGVGGPGWSPQQGGRPGMMMGPVMATGAVGAASAVAGAGRALMPLIDKLANTMIGDNPVLLDDLRRAQMEIARAQANVDAAMADAQNLRDENFSLKQKLGEYEEQLGLPRSFPLVVSDCGQDLGEGASWQDADNSSSGGHGQQQQGGDGPWPLLESMDHGAAGESTAPREAQQGEGCVSHPTERWSEETGQGFSEAGEGEEGGKQSKLQPVAES